MLFGVGIERRCGVWRGGGTELKCDRCGRGSSIPPASRDGEAIFGHWLCLSCLRELKHYVARWIKEGVKDSQ